MTCSTVGNKIWEQPTCPAIGDWLKKYSTSIQQNTKHLFLRKKMKRNIYSYLLRFV